MSLDADTINQQQALLVAHRRTLAALLQQLALLGGVVYATPGILVSIEDARANIAGIKATLKAASISVTDEPNDEALPEAPAVALSSTQKNADQRALDAALDTYISQMEQLILEKYLLASQSDDPVRTVAKTRTITALRRLDGEHNQQLIQFVRDVGLFRGLLPFDIHLAEAKLSGADLSGANLSRANLSGADLSGANLIRADLSVANLSRANLSGANLSRADLGRADLSRANLSRANLSGANLSWANLSGANLSGAIVTKWQLLAAQGLEGVTMPDGSKHS